MPSIRRKSRNANARRRAIRTSGVLAVLAACTVAAVASRDLPRYRAAPAPAIHGVFHVHSDSSHDGKVSYTSLLEAARAVGADFVVFTDHNVRPDRLQPAGGPIVVSGSELSTPRGHLIQLGLSEAPGKAMRDSSGLLDYLHREGAIGIAAHPESPRRRWGGPDAELDGLEIASSSSDFRVRGGENYLGLAGPLAAYPFNRALAVAQLYRRDDATLARWDALVDPAVAGLCGTDTHGWIDPAVQFRTWRVVLDPEDGAGIHTPGAVVEHVRRGRFFCLAGLLEGDVPDFRFFAERPGQPARSGDTVAADSVSALAVEARILERGSTEIVLFRDGVPVARDSGGVLRYETPAPGTYRIEVRARLPRLLLGSFEVPILYSNRIRLY